MFTVTQQDALTYPDMVGTEKTDALLTWVRSIRGWYDYTIILEPGIPYRLSTQVLQDDGTPNNNVYNTVTLSERVYCMRRRYEKTLEPNHIQIGVETRYFTESDSGLVSLVKDLNIPGNQPHFKFEMLPEEAFVQANLVAVSIEETINANKRNSKVLYDYPMAQDFYEAVNPFTELLEEQFKVILKHNIDWIQYNPEYQRDRGWTKQ